MSTNLFLAFSREASVPLHIVAQSIEDAQAAYKDWVIAHSLPWSSDPKKIESAVQAWLEEQPQLEQAVVEASELPEAMILYWLSHAEGWTARTARAKPAGKITPPEPLIQVFEVTVPDEETLLIFADNITQALQIFLDYREQWGKPWSMPADSATTITPLSRWKLQGPQTVLREQMDNGHVGIAGWSPTTGWGIYQFDHELAGEC